MRRLIGLGLVGLLAGCATLGTTWVKTANDAIACTVGILTEVSAGKADPALVALGHHPSIDQIVQALKDAQAMLPATLAACAALASDFSLPATPQPPAPPTAAASGAVPNPWHQP